MNLTLKANVLAGIIQTNGIDLNTAKLVVVASGTKNIDAELLSPDALNDTHAEVVARRALLFYFYQQLELFSDSSKKFHCAVCIKLITIDNHSSIIPAKSDKSIFKHSPYGNGIRLKNNIHFHLYINKVPCGDASDTSER